MGHSGGLARFGHETRAPDTTQPAAGADAAVAAGDPPAAAVEHGARARAQHRDRIQPAARARRRPPRTARPTRDRDASTASNGAAKRRPRAANPRTSATTARSISSFERSDYRGNALDEDGLEPQDAEVEDLRDHLLWQLNLTPMSARDRAIAAALIEAIDDDGYLTESRRVDPGAASPRSTRVTRRRNRIGAPSRAALRSGRRRQPLAARMPRRAARHARCSRRRRSRSRARGQRASRSARAAGSHAPVPARARDRRGIRDRGRADPLAVAQARRRLFEREPPNTSRRMRTRARSAAAGRSRSRRGCQPRLGINEHYASLIAKARREDAQLPARPAAGSALADQEPEDARRNDAEGRRRRSCARRKRSSNSAPKRCARSC